MTDTTLLDRVDPAGAIEEAAAAAGVSRRELMGACVAGGSLAALGSALFTDDALAQSRPSRTRDRRILTFALLLEQLGASYYLEAIGNEGVLPVGSQELLYATTVRRDELAHVRFVSTAIRQLGGRPTAAPNFDFGDTTEEIGRFRDTASTIENLCVAALNGAGPLLRRATLAAAARMVSAEARPAAWIDDIRGQNPIPDAFDPALSLRQVATRVNRTDFVPRTVRAPRV